jgi:hypothetical protein
MILPLCPTASSVDGVTVSPSDLRVADDSAKINTAFLDVGEPALLWMLDGIVGRHDARVAAALGQTIQLPQNDPFD